MEVSPYICVMDNKQMTKLIKKGLGKKTFPFEYGNNERNLSLCIR